MKKLATCNSGLIILLMIFSFMYVLNTLTPLLADDYFSAFLWPEKVRLNDVSHEAVKRMASFKDIYEGIKGYYFTWGGRVPGGIPVSFFLWQGKEFFNPCNAFLFTLLVAEIYWLSHEGKLTLSFKASYIFWIFFALWAFNVSFVDTCLWLAGSCNYLWMLVIVRAFLIPYVRNFFDSDAFKNCKKELTTGIFFWGLLAGWSHETTNCWIILLLSYWLYGSYKKGDLPFWKITGYIGFCLGYALLIFAPGNFSRLQMQQGTTNVIIPSSLLSYKLIELAVIFTFHFILWYLVIRFFFKFNKHRNKFAEKATGIYLIFALSFILVSFGSGLLMFFIPSNGLRPSFLNLVYLIIASTLLFRIQEVNNHYFVNGFGKLFLKVIGCIYLIITIAFSLWGNYINKCYLDDMLIKINEAHNNSVNAILEFPPPLTMAMKDSIWLRALGIYLAPVPVTREETHEFNKVFSYYYGIKGIKITE